MVRPSEAEVQEALAVLDACDLDVVEDAAAVLREALRPRELWTPGAVAQELGMRDSRNLKPNLPRGLPEPFVTVPYPRGRNRDAVIRLWDADEIRTFAAQRRERGAK